MPAVPSVPAYAPAVGGVALAAALVAAAVRAGYLDMRRSVSPVDPTGTSEPVRTEEQIAMEELRSEVDKIRCGTAPCRWSLPQVRRRLRPSHSPHESVGAIGPSGGRRDRVAAATGGFSPPRRGSVTDRARAAVEEGRAEEWDVLSRASTPSRREADSEPNAAAGPEDEASVSVPGASGDDLPRAEGRAPEGRAPERPPLSSAPSRAEPRSPWSPVDSMRAFTDAAKQHWSSHAAEGERSEAASAAPDGGLDDAGASARSGTDNFEAANAHEREETEVGASAHSPGSDWAWPRWGRGGVGDDDAEAGARQLDWAGDGCTRMDAVTSALGHLGCSVDA